MCRLLESRSKNSSLACYFCGVKVESGEGIGERGVEIVVSFQFLHRHLLTIMHNN